jgi:hypothetical protein
MTEAPGTGYADRDLPRVLLQPWKVHVLKAWYWEVGNLSEVGPSGRSLGHWKHEIALPTGLLEKEQAWAHPTLSLSASWLEMWPPAQHVPSPWGPHHSWHRHHGLNLQNWAE